MSDLRKVQMKETRLAVVLIDIIGSTAFVQRHGAVKSALHFQKHDRWTRNLCYRFHGREIDRSDGFLMSFNSVMDAVNFGLHYQRTIPAKTHLKARIGIHWGCLVEVSQSEVYVGVGAKKIELEGLAKNIAARTMSLCEEGQVLLTAEAMQMARGRVNKDTPKATRYVCVGEYKFKGVRQPQKIYAVGETIHSLRSPKGNDKVKKVRSRKVKYRYRDMTRSDWLRWAFRKGIYLSILVCLWIFYCLCSTSLLRDISGLHEFEWVGDLGDYLQHIADFFKRFKRVK